MILFNELNHDKIKKTTKRLRGYYGDTMMQLPYSVATLAAILDLSERMKKTEEALNINCDTKNIAEKYLKRRNK